jgi:transcriptional regulator with XRE-family HTH domain
LNELLRITENKVITKDKLARKLNLGYYRFIRLLTNESEKLTVEKIAILSQYLGISENELFNIILSEYLRKNPLKTGKAQKNTKK